MHAHTENNHSNQVLYRISLHKQNIQTYLFLAAAALSRCRRFLNQFPTIRNKQKPMVSTNKPQNQSPVQTLSGRQTGLMCEFAFFGWVRIWILQVPFA